MATRHQLEPGDALVFFTDGVTEALNMEERFYSLSRLEGFLTGVGGPARRADHPRHRPGCAPLLRRARAGGRLHPPRRALARAPALLLFLTLHGPEKSRSPLKHYVLDTNVLLHDPQSLFHFEENQVWLPIQVLEELDKFKAESSTRGANAREVHRRLSERFRTAEEMREGVPLENGGRLHVCLRPGTETARKARRDAAPALHARAFPG